jgi:hypothetical protein
LAQPFGLDHQAYVRCLCYACLMPFNHYAKIKRILEQQPDDWIIKRINEPTHAKNFKGEAVDYAYYYRIYDSSGQPLKYCKFQQIERLARALKVSVEALPIVD